MSAGGPHGGRVRGRGRGQGAGDANATGPMPDRSPLPVAPSAVLVAVALGVVPLLAARPPPPASTASPAACHPLGRIGRDSVIPWMARQRAPATMRPPARRTCRGGDAGSGGRRDGGVAVGGDAQPPGRRATGGRSGASLGVGETRASTLAAARTAGDGRTLGDGQSAPSCPRTYPDGPSAPPSQGIGFAHKWAFLGWSIREVAPTRWATGRTASGRDGGEGR
jgi:hypothetical protein